MSDYCKQCSIQLFGEDYGDLAGISTAADTANGMYAAVLCEGCGEIQVDHTGQCISECFREHKDRGGARG